MSDMLILVLVRNDTVRCMNLTPYLNDTKTENAWEESKHPRDKDGRFGKSGDTNDAKEDKKMIKTEDFLGNEYTGVKGKDAIDLLMKEKQGFVRNAFSRKDIGDIALIWGNDHIGLQHIIKRRKETNQDLEALLEKMPDIIDKGELKKSGGQFKIEYAGNRMIISPELFGNEFQFILTAYELNK